VAASAGHFDLKNLAFQTRPLDYVKDFICRWSQLNRADQILLRNEKGYTRLTPAKPLDFRLAIEAPLGCTSST